MTLDWILDLQKGNEIFWSLLFAPPFLLRLSLYALTIFSHNLMFRDPNNRFYRQQTNREITSFVSELSTAVFFQMSNSSGYGSITN
jgi:hypothetical protein